MAEDYPSNSHKARESSLVREDVPDKVKNRPIAKHESAKPVRARSVSPAKEIFSALFPGGLAEVKEHLVWDIFVPWMQDMLHSGWEGMGNVLFPGSSRTQPTSAYTSYNSSYRYGSAQRPAAQHHSQSQSWRTSNYQEAVFGSKIDAEDKLRTFQDILSRYRVITLLDYNEELGFTTGPGDVHYGWISLATARVERTYDGWVLVMPRPVEIS